MLKVLSQRNAGHRRPRFAALSSSARLLRNCVDPANSNKSPPSLPRSPRAADERVGSLFARIAVPREFLCPRRRALIFPRDFQSALYLKFINRITMCINHNLNFILGPAIKATLKICYARACVRMRASDTGIPSIRGTNSWWKSFNNFITGDSLFVINIAS